MSIREALSSQCVSLPERNMITFLLQVCYFGPPHLCLCFASVLPQIQLLGTANDKYRQPPINQRVRSISNCISTYH